MNKEEHDEYHKRLLFVLTIMVILFFGGAFMYTKLEGWRLIDAMYFAAATMTTVGYGDITPQTIYGKLFTIFYLFTSVGMAFYGLSLFAAHFVEVREDEWVERIEGIGTKKHVKNFHNFVKSLFIFDSEKISENDEIKKK